ncbi:MAG: hypothetical protein IPN68_03930 [Bacteroidetes bacterium]|nr:hypothetical protein [Bacteroidota bacterium]
MTDRSEFNIKAMFLILLILAGWADNLFSQDKKISNIINIYKRVESIGTTPKDNVTLTDVSGLFVGDTVLIIQMKGAVINVPETGDYGSYKDLIGMPGLSEFMIVESIDTDTRNVVFTSNITNSYDVLGRVQLVRVPYFNSATVTSTLTCQPWDSVSKTGGVLAMIVGRTLSLEADIDVSGKGFNGGAISQGDGICIIPGGGNSSLIRRALTIQDIKVNHLPHVHLLVLVMFLLYSRDMLRAGGLILPVVVEVMANFLVAVAVQTGHSAEVREEKNLQFVSPTMMAG